MIVYLQKRLIDPPEANANQSQETNLRKKSQASEAQIAASATSLLRMPDAYNHHAVKIL